LQKGAFRTDMGFRAWNVEGSYILTGGKKSFAGTTPKHNFDPKNHGWGAWEIAYGFGEFNAVPAFYTDGFGTPTTTPREAHERVGGVNWYLNRLFRFTADYGNTAFGGGN